VSPLPWPGSHSRSAPMSRPSVSAPCAPRLPLTRQSHPAASLSPARSLFTSPDPAFPSLTVWARLSARHLPPPAFPAALPTLLRPARAVKLHCPVDPSPCRTHWQPPVRAPLPETSSPEPGIARDCCAIRFNRAQAPPRSPAITFLRQSAVILGPTFKLHSEASTPAPCPPAQP
jgi:hypothetical protein